MVVLVGAQGECSPPESLHHALLMRDRKQGDSICSGKCYCSCRLDIEVVALLRGLRSLKGIPVVMHWG